MARTAIRMLTVLWLVVSLILGNGPAVAGNVSSSDHPEPNTQTSGQEGVNPLEPSSASSALDERVTHPIYLKSRLIQPEPDQAALDQLVPAGAERVHVLVQLDFIPRQAAKDELARQGLKLLDYLPDYAWIAAVDAGAAPGLLNLPGVVWAGGFQVDDKLDEAVRENRWSSFNTLPDGHVAVYVMLHADESIETGRGLVANHGGQVKSTAEGANLLVVEMPQDNLRALAAEGAVQWIEPAAPVLGPANDGIRQQIGVNTVQAAPYNLDGTNVDVLVYDSGNIGTHTDFGTRLWSAGDDTVQEHSTHVAGIIGGSGANSAAMGGSALQWRGMAPNVDLISYGTGWTSGVIFYQDVGDIEADFAAAQNTRGADLANASVGSNLYKNYLTDPNRCTWMGNYGASDVVIDQMIRGGNAAVGIGDKYITVWAAGNERNSTNSCSNTYNSIAPPGAAKNPIHVGAINTNNNAMTTFSSWGPTDDGRIKPTVVSGGCQSTGDGGITSTDNSPVNAYTVMCGTSMSSPSVTGGVALMLQAYRQLYNTTGNFWPSSAKALLIQTATDLGNPGPDYQNGFGLVNIQNAVDLINRKGLYQTNIAHAGWKYFSAVVASSASPLRVSLAWDDREATLNANPTLINNLDLELVAPSGTVWRPWILNAASPANNATRGTDNRNNQEQVEVTAPEVGTWLVRVRGTNVPQGPQDFSLACEGCRTLDVGVCTNTTSINTAADFLPMAEGAQVPLPDAPEPVEETQVRTPGEAWQQALEAGLAPDEAEQAHQMAELEQAREAGPGAVRDLLGRLSGAALDLAQDELAEMEENEPLVALPDKPAVSPETEEQANLQARQAAQPAVVSQNDPAEGIPQGTAEPDAASSLAPAADRTVGPGCTYATIAAAVTAASPGDRLRLAGNVTFTEHLTISKNLTVEGGYNGCTSASSAPTTIDGTSNGLVLDITQGTVALSNLIITNGTSGAEGGGIRFGITTAGALTLTNIEVHHNTGYWGGGVWIGANSSLTATGLNIHDNTATSFGGGLRLFGGRAALSSSNIHHNSAPYGGGVYASVGNAFAPSLNLASAADIYSNTASGTGLGGGLYLAGGTATVTASSDIYSNTAVQGGGAYLATGTLSVSGTSSEIMSNTSSAEGGGVYASSASAVLLNEGAEIYSNTAGSGGGAYLDASSLTMYSGSIWYNTATVNGGGIAAFNNPTVTLGVSASYCTTTPCLRLENNTASSYGGGLYLDSGSASINYTRVMNNAAVLGGGMYVTGGALNANSALLARNNATSTAGDGLRLYNGATFNGVGVTFANNNAGGTTDGRAIDLYSSTVNLSCSIIWNHTVSLSDAAQNVDYSDVQGGYTGAANLNTNPLFVNAGASDFHLQSGSPVRDRCPSSSTYDMDLELRPILLTQPASPFDMGADEVTGANRVGVDGACAYATIQQAVNAAPAGATIRVAAGVFFETVDISKSLTVQGGYNATCTTAGAGETRVEGVLQGGSVFDISGTGSVVTLRDLSVRWGTGIGAGIDALGTSQITLNKVKLYDNHGSHGGGVYVASTAAVTMDNDTDIHNNTASTAGGGVRVWGTFNGYADTSDVYANCAPDGGGISVPGGTLLLDNADVVQNQAAGATGKGGGIHVTGSGQVTLRNSVFIGETLPGPNLAYDGAGIYADASQVTLEGAATTICNNDAQHFGGGIYLANGSTLTSTGARIGNPINSGCGGSALSGAGIYASGSTVNFTGSIYNNKAVTSGGGIFATASTLNLTNASVGGTDTNQANWLTGTGGYNGPGIYLEAGTNATLDATTISSNQWTATLSTYGGGLYVNDSTAVLQNGSRVEKHVATSTSDARGAGIYLNSATLTMDHSIVTENDSQIGGGIRVFNNSVLNVRNGSSIDHNSATQLGGGIAVGVADASTPDVNIENTTLQYNTAGTDGGAVYTHVGTLDFTGWWDLRWNHADGNGGGLVVAGSADADLTASGGPSYFAVNSANGSGGGIYLANTDTVNLHATNSYLVSFNTNTAGGNGGGGYANAGGYFDVYGNLQMTSNQAAGNGGLFYLSGGSRVWFDDYVTTKPQILVNQAANGGAIYADGGSNVECDGAVFGMGVNGNKATSGSGGAVYLNNTPFSADNCTFLNNKAAVHGGAIYAVNSALTIQSSFAAPDVRPEEAADPAGVLATACNPNGECSSFHDNLADSDANNTGNGGAFYISGGSLTMTFTHLYRNQAVRGGAIFQTGAAASTVENSLFHANGSTAGLGGGIRSENGTFSVTHVTIADSTHGAGFSSNNAGSLVINSIAWGNANGGFYDTFSPSSTCNIDQSNIIGLNADPKFLGGSDYHLQSTSPAVDACNTGLGKDLNNHTRPIGSKYDMGAYEGGHTRIYIPSVSR